MVSSLSSVSLSSSVLIRPVVVHLPNSTENSEVSTKTNASYSLSSSSLANQHQSASIPSTSTSSPASYHSNFRTNATLFDPNSLLPVLQPSSVISSVSSQGIQTWLSTGTITRKDYSCLTALFPEVHSLNLEDDAHFSGGFTFLADIKDASEPSNFKQASQIP